MELICDLVEKEPTFFEKVTSEEIMDELHDIRILVHYKE
jgi:hypothetical protein